MYQFQIKVPASSANIGPGFDVLGMSLEVYMTLDVQVGDDKGACVLSYEGDGANEVPLDIHKNMISQTALYVLRCHDIHEFPLAVKIHVKNPIPLGRGMGSSGSAAIAGVLLANELAHLKLSKLQMMDYVLMIERHPDNVMASMMGGFVGSFLRELSDVEKEAMIPSASDLLTNQGFSRPPKGLGTYAKLPWAPELKALVVIPQFHLSTSKARSVLPSSYTKPDVIYNLQRLALLTTALGQTPINAHLIHEVMKDKVHQPYRSQLIPGLQTILAQMTPESQPGLCGICLSGAGPTILALATDNYEEIAQKMLIIFKQNNVDCNYLVLSPAFEGASVTY
ncbi:homoserine kinase [Schizosaccharomyces cryophilus OY26]|uniref:Homoserine kinase n=1 Tax=Schizosaccharomyces cryophilus (strain OY26 / ATCC MYA-4695 / CBS 11777 / NBRC 106824 / NRRL Y48691) TaxID=653667 RepID=S9W1T2_SCHCR|nr:homoserine kinase [Schizosaccharomyces cryophilus OY26]EPY54008.1 homoserine kinase [Schizosaccharomyces cryophilus OY26]